MPAVVALIVVVLIAMPFFSLRLGTSDQGNDPTCTTTRQAYDLLSAGFGPGFNGPLQLVAEQKGQVDTQTLDTAGRRRRQASPAWPPWCPRSCCPPATASRWR